jgi:hypothetical protein
MVLKIIMQNTTALGMYSTKERTYISQFQMVGVMQSIGIVTPNAQVIVLGQNLRQEQFFNQLLVTMGMLHL